MKMISKIAKATLGLLLVGSSVFSQSLADAKKAIDAEQYQKAKSMLKNLTVTEAAKDENYFYLGWVYLLQDYPDSAKTWFTKGVGINPKSALNYAGLGVAAHLDKDEATATTNYNQAIALAGKNTKPYVYIGKGYLLHKPVSAPNANAAIAILTKGKAINAKDPELLIALGDAYRSQLKSNDAYSNYSDALALDPKSPLANVAEGVLWSYANNYDDAIKQFQAALAVDPNFGPAYREWAETLVRQAHSDPKNSATIYAQAADLYKKYINLTDMSLESQMRYADFLISAQDYKTLATVAADISKSANANLRAYRYLCYADYENKDYAGGLTACNVFISKADPKRILPSDYLYLGKLQLASGQDSLGIQSLTKAYQMDSTQTDVFAEIAKSYYAKKKYDLAGDAYAKFLSSSRSATLNDYFREGLSYYLAYLYDTPEKKLTDTAFLIKADTAFSYVQHKAGQPVAPVTLYQARSKDFQEKDRNNIKGLALPFYEQYIALTTAKPGPYDDQTKKNLIEAYLYDERYYMLVAKDVAKATDAYNKAKDLDPTSKDVLDAQKVLGSK
jgi:tetratricopeptide (TPR) repeat protein